MAPREAGATYAGTQVLVKRRRAAYRLRKILRARISPRRTKERRTDLLSDVSDRAADPATILRTIHASKAAGVAGRVAESDELLARAAHAAPGHPAVLNELGLRMMQRGEPAKARELFERATQADAQHPALWSNLASSLHALRSHEEEMRAIERALALEPRHLPALLQKGVLAEERGDVRIAARIYRSALATVPSDVTPPPSLSAALDHAREVVRSDDTAVAHAIEAALAAIRERHGGGPYRRLDKCVELFTGRRSRYAPLPTFMYFPDLPAPEFLERTEFPWLGALEAATGEIRSELTDVLGSRTREFVPYVAYPEGAPLDQWKELNQSRRWSAYFLWNQGVAQREHLASCTRTAALLQRVPQCDVADHGPTAFFSILDARTHIPPHTGVTNARVTVHLPLIVPPGCTFRVGGETREWIPGEAWVFDDTIEHEAWNRSDTPRAILIFDVWNPYLSAAERDLVRAAIEAVGAYYRPTSDATGT